MYIHLMLFPFRISNIMQNSKSDKLWAKKGGSLCLISISLREWGSSLHLFISFNLAKHPCFHGVLNRFIYCIAFCCLNSSLPHLRISSVPSNNIFLSFFSLSTYSPFLRRFVWQFKYILPVWPRYFKAPLSCWSISLYSIHTHSVPIHSWPWFLFF